MKKGPRVRLLSPDGFDMYAGEDYRNREEAWKTYRKWVKNYEKQGYYSSNEGRISLENLPQEMTIKEIL